MSIKLFMAIPDDILNLYIFPLIEEKYKILLSKEYYNKYHNNLYNFSYKYLGFIIKNNIAISIKFLSQYKDFDITKRIKLTYDKKVFISVYDFCVYMSKKYKNTVFLDYFCSLYEKNIDSRFSKLRIKQYKNFIDKNILWIK